MKQYTETRSRIDVVKSVDDGKGNVSTETTKFILMEDDAKKRLEKLLKDAENATITKTQTFQLYKAESLADVSELSGSESNAVAIWNRGAVLKQQADAKGYLADDEWNAVDGTFDLKGDLASESERGEKKTPEEKALGDLLKLDAAGIERVLEAYRAAAAQKSASDAAQPSEAPQAVGA